MELLAEWGAEILLAVITAAAVGYAKWQGRDLRKQLDDAKKYAEKQAEEKVESIVEHQLEPIIQELEDLRAYVRDNENVQKTQINLIIASYKYRMVQLCKAYLAQQYITTYQLDQLTEFYKLYTGLGGNGQAKTYYEKVLQLPVKVVNDPDVAPDAV